MPLNDVVRITEYSFNQCINLIHSIICCLFIQDEVEIKRDTERQDEIRAMKQAWEAAEPGRAAKAQAAREKFLKEHLIKVEQPEDEAESPEKAEVDLEGGM